MDTQLPQSIIKYIIDYNFKSEASIARLLVCSRVDDKTGYNYSMCKAAFLCTLWKPCYVVNCLPIARGLSLIAINVPVLTINLAHCNLTNCKASSHWFQTAWYVHQVAWSIVRDCMVRSSSILCCPTAGQFMCQTIPPHCPCTHRNLFHRSVLPGTPIV